MHKLEMKKFLIYYEHSSHNIGMYSYYIGDLSKLSVIDIS